MGLSSRRPRTSTVSCNLEIACKASHRCRIGRFASLPRLLRKAGHFRRGRLLPPGEVPHGRQRPRRIASESPNAGSGGAMMVALRYSKSAGERLCGSVLSCLARRDRIRIDAGLHCSSAFFSPMQAYRLGDNGLNHPYSVSCKRHARKRS